MQLTNTSVIPPVPEVTGFENGRPATGNIITTSAQLIGLEPVLGARHPCLLGSIISSPALDKGTLVTYNNSSLMAEVWQVEPSIQTIANSTTPVDAASAGHRDCGSPTGAGSVGRWNPTSAYEIGRASRQVADQPARCHGHHVESAHRANYSLGARYEF